jgi:hypothetical protein
MGLRLATVLFLPLLHGLPLECGPGGSRAWRPVAARHVGPDLFYSEGAVESVWVPGGGARLDGRICQTAQRQADALLASVGEAATLNREPWRVNSAHPPPDGSQLSAIARCTPCGGASSGNCSYEAIEPLTGLARHPFSAMGCRVPRHVSGGRRLRVSSVGDTSHMIVASHCAPPHPPSGAPAAPSPVRAGRNLFYDAGCSTWAAAGRNPSIPRFVNMYAQNCIAFDHITGWEMTKHNLTEWWAAVPPEWRDGRLTFHNEPVAVGGRFDPLLEIARTARPEDFVSFKLDIDYFDLEAEIAEEIRTNARGTNASLLIDEFFFEFHFATPREPNFSRFWRRGQRGGTVDGALDLMHALRSKGIRAHFWI